MRNKGFTLLEILIVLVILSVVAGLMFPVLSVQVERSRAQEAVTALGTVKEAMVRYWQREDPGNYTGATFATIGFDPNLDAAGQTRHFTYELVSDALTFDCTAKRRFGGDPLVDRVTIDETGTVVKYGVYQ